MSARHRHTIEAPPPETLAGQVRITLTEQDTVLPDGAELLRRATSSE